MSNLDEFFGMSPRWDAEPSANEAELHQGGLDHIDPAFDATHYNLLAGAIGLDPADPFTPSEDQRLTIEKQLPQWGPPFVKFVDHRISELEKLMNKAMERWQFETVTVVDF